MLWIEGRLDCAGRARPRPPVTGITEPATVTFGGTDSTGPSGGFEGPVWYTIWPWPLAKVLLLGGGYGATAIWAGETLVRLPSEFLRTPFEGTKAAVEEDEDEEALIMASRPLWPPVWICG